MLACGAWSGGVLAGAPVPSAMERLEFATGRHVACLCDGLTGSARRPGVRTAVIVIHGLGRQTASNHAAIRAAARASGVQAETMVLAPWFRTRADAPGKDGHFWSRNGWSSGALSRDSQRRRLRLSSFAVVDHLFEALLDRRRFPNLRRIVLAGHSAGGQFVNRYIAVGRAGGERVGATVERRFVVANPSSYLYLDERRPRPGRPDFVIPRRPPRGFNDWRHGLASRNAYARRLAEAEIRDQVFSRRAFYLIGELDRASAKGLSTTPPSMLQGRNRHHRWQNYRRYVALFPRWRAQASFVEVPRVAHSGRQIFASRQARKAIFE